MSKDERLKLKHPMQPVGFDGQITEHNSRGVARFKENPIVRYLLDEGPFDLNHLARVSEVQGWTRDDHAQLAQLIGYSVSGFGDLSYVRKKLIAKADKRVEKLRDG